MATNNPNITATDENGEKLSDSEVRVNGRAPSGGSSVETGLVDSNDDGTAELVEDDADLGGGDLLNVGNFNTPGGFAGLSDTGTLLTSQVPDLAITEVYVVASQSDRLALTDIQEGDVAIEEDTDDGYIFSGGDPSQSANWSQLSSYNVPVDSVFGRTGDVQAQETDYDSFYALLGGDPNFASLSIGGDMAIQGVVASGSVTLSSGSAIVDLGLSASGATFDPAIGVDDPGADVKLACRLFWDSSAGTYKLEIVEDGTSVGNPTVNYDIKRVR
ncbi:hypothetical protein C471_09435 [Halorubrum saccharovorum DSM 1137]|uniref:Uncharacterized protein n=1 Tax=Halorubrum saccharovorum DSM 1137 TaxID=1227484 RepID=M0DVN5_9EURY|nr:hypothetical protein [Halorubrum saccharovorum]ELZ38782.1 hypothetical protein C471_09435 [Halorubrum saccharovorum DSM 1137]